MIAFLCSVVPMVISFLIILYSGDKAVDNAVEYKGPKKNFEISNTNNHQEKRGKTTKTEDSPD